MRSAVTSRKPNSMNLKCSRSIALLLCFGLVSVSAAIASGADLDKLIDDGNAAYKTRRFAKAEQHFSAALKEAEELGVENVIKDRAILCSRPGWIASLVNINETDTSP